jgi:transposase
MAEIVFKELNSNQNVLFPTNLLERIPSNHPVLPVNQIVDELNLDKVFSTYHPRMMLKVLFYAYPCNIHSCRKIARCLQENIYFMWLSGNSTPDFRTINRFRGEHPREHIKDLFTQIVLMLNPPGYLSPAVRYIDGTKTESASNRYGFVRRGSVGKHKAKLEEKIHTVPSSIDSHMESDQQASLCDDTPESIDTDELKAKVKEPNCRHHKMTKTEQKQVKQLREDYLPRLEKYQDQLQKPGDRNSYGKAGEDATFMRMKEYRMKNAQLKPAYNIQTATEEQFITHAGIYQRAGDTPTLPSFPEDFEKSCHKQSKTVAADAGYGSGQNYEFMENNQMEAYVKYNYFHKEQKRARKKNAFAVQNLFYSPDMDLFLCPMGERMVNTGTKKSKSDLGYIPTVTRCQARNCTGCPLRGLCHESKTNRVMEVDYKLQNYKKKSRRKIVISTGHLPQRQAMHRTRSCLCTSKTQLTVQPV